MPVGTEDVEVKSAEVTGASPSDAQETSTAKEPAKPAEVIDGREADEEKEKPEDKNSPLYERTKKYQRQRDEARDTLGKLKEFGIESPEHADFLQREARRIETVETQLRENPKAFESDLLKEFPKAHEEIVSLGIAREFSADPLAFEQRLFQMDEGAYSRMAGNVVSRHLAYEAAQVKASDPDLAKYLDALSSKYADTRPAKARKTEPAQQRTEPTVDGERQAFYDEQVENDATGRLVEQINKVLTDRNVEFKTDRQKTAFREAVLDRVTEVLRKDSVFVKELARIDDPRHGLTQSQRKASADYWVKFATMNSRLSKAVSEELEERNLSIGTAKAPPNERREINGGGAPSGGTPAKSESDRIYGELQAKGLRGAALDAAHSTAMVKMRLGR